MSMNGNNKAKSIKLVLNKTSKIRLTDDSDTSYSNIDFNAYKLYANRKVIN